MDRKAKLRIFGKLLDAGFDDEKKVMNFQLKDLLETDIRNDEIGAVIELQQAVKNHKVIAYFADKAEETGQKRNGGYENEGL